MSAASILVLGLIFSCGSDAVGVEACRQLESARCRLAEACGEVPDATSCERFYRDQCLHGLSIPEPSERDVDVCTAALDTAAECARTNDDSAACADACGAVGSPASLRECAFLATEDDPNDPGEGGQGGSAGPSPATSGSGGAAGGQGGTGEPDPGDEGQGEGGSSGADQSAGTAGSDTN